MQHDFSGTPSTIDISKVSGPADRSKPDLSTSRRSTVSIVITTFNHATYLSEAIGSVLSQSKAADEIIVVDDGSEDDPASVADAFPEVVLIRQHNQGLSAARNTGIAAAKCDFIVFLDADDRLLPTALEAGLECHGAAEGLAFVYGGHRRIAADGTVLDVDQYTPVAHDPYLQLLEGNAIGMHAVVMYRHLSIAEAGGFDVTLRRCEDYDMYLRLARSCGISSHPVTVAEYRQHELNMSSNPREMLKFTLQVQKRAAALSKYSADVARAQRRGRTNWRTYYAREILAMTHKRMPGSEREEVGKLFRTRRRSLIQALRISPPSVAKWLVKGGVRRVQQMLHRYWPRLRSVRFGDLAGTSPIDRDFGYGRGTPVDRFYVEAFLTRHQLDIAGHVLEIGDDGYSRRFGGKRIQRQDVLHVAEGNPAATIVGDLSETNVLPAESFDCIVLTQTLHLIYDMRKAIGHVYAALKPGGVLLLTVPGVSSVDRGNWGASWYWSLTPAAVQRLLLECFHASSLEIDFGGNVFAATCFLQGIAQEDVREPKLLVRDPSYPVIVTARARKAAAA